jgi:catechol 2,3-dioxygenase-like lactoylglutathione lyase family enzyme
LALGIVIGASAQNLVGQQGDITGLNHVAFAVENFGAATKFYTDVMGFPEAFAFREPDGRPTLSYFQVNRNTFIELMPATRSDRRDLCILAWRWRTSTRP